MFENRYTVINRIAAGHMSEVLKAFDRRNNRVVALKRVSKNKVRAVNFLKKEFETLTYFDHPNIVKVFDYGEDNEYIYYSMEYLAGNNFGNDLRRLKRLPAFLNFSVQILSALDYIHNRGVIHGDVKPGNIFEDRTKSRKRFILGDFGLLRHIKSDITQIVSGTMEYIAPEVFEGISNDPRSDLYSFGLLLFFILTGRLPFAPGADVLSAKRKPTYKYLDLGDVLPSADPRITRVLTYFIQHNPADRFSSADESLKAFDELFTGFKIKPRYQRESEPKLATGKLFGYTAEVNRVCGHNTRINAAGVEVFWVDGMKGAGKTFFLRQVCKRIRLNGGISVYIDCGGYNNVVVPLGEEIVVKDYGRRAASDDLTGRETALLEGIITGDVTRYTPQERSIINAINDYALSYDPVVLALDNVDPADKGFERLTSRLMNLNSQGIIKILVSLKKPVPERAPALFAPGAARGSGKTLRYERIFLKGFGEDTLKEYLEFVLGVPTVDPVMLRYVEDNSGGGNPGAIKRVIEAMLSGKVLVRRLDGWRVDYIKLKNLRIPTDSHDYYKGVINHISEGDRRALATAALCGQFFPAAIITDDKVLKKLVSAGVIEKPNRYGGEYCFASGGLRNYVYEHVTKKRLYPSLIRVEEVLTERGIRNPELLATVGNTYLLLNDVGRARETLSDAARLYRNNNDHEKAVGLLEAIVATRGDWNANDYVEIVSDLADSYSALGFYGHALRYYERAAAACRKTSGDYYEYLLKVARERLALGEIETAIPELNKLTSNKLNPANVFLRHVLLAWCYYEKRDFKKSFLLIKKAEGVAASLKRRDLAAYVEYVKGVVLSHLRERPRAEAALRKAAELAEAEDKTRLSSLAYSLLGGVLAAEGEFEEAVASAVISIKFAKKADDRYALASSHERLGRIYFSQGYVERAQRKFELAEAECKFIDNPEISASIYLSSAANMIRAGEYRRAEFYLELVDSLKGKPESTEGYVRSQRAQLFAETGELQKALAEIDAAGRSLRKHGTAEETSLLSSLRGRILYLTGELSKAEAEVEGCKHAFEKKGIDEEYANVLITLSEIALQRRDFEKAALYIEEALKRFARLNNKYYLGKCYLIKAQTRGLSSSGKPDVDSLAEINSDLDRAKVLFQEIGVNKYRAEIFKLESEVVMANRPRESGKDEERVAKLARGVERLSSFKRADELFAFLLQYLTRELGADRGILLLLDKNTNVFRIKGTAGVDDTTIEDASAISRTVISRVAGTKKPVLSPDAGTDPRFKNSPSVHLCGVKSLACIPVRAARNFTGVLYFDSFEKEALFDEAALAFAQVFAENAAYKAEKIFDGRQDTGALLDLKAAGPLASAEIIGSSAKISNLRSVITRAARSQVDVLVLGESGTGKELVAKMIHALGPHADKPLISINCAAIPEALFESELFGIEKGTATGVDKRIGFFERAGDGTIFLDEVAAIDFATQAKFLRVLQEKQFYRVGARELNAIPLKARIISATNADPARAIANRKLREDLYFRLNVFPIECPPLREHKEDIPELVEHFVRRYRVSSKRATPRFSVESLRALGAYDWPGNVRELENCVRYALANSPAKVIDPASLPLNLAGERKGETRGGGEGLNREVARLERKLIVDALRDANWVKGKAASILGISETNLRYKMKKYDIKEKERFEYT